MVEIIKKIIYSVTTLIYQGQCIDLKYACSYFQSTIEHPASSVSCLYNDVDTLSVVRDSISFTIYAPSCDYSEVHGAFVLGITWGMVTALTIISVKLILRSIQRR